MTIFKEVWVRCDHPHCGETAFPSRTAFQARKDAKQNGWTHINGKDFCPRHAPLKNQNKEVNTK